MGKTKVRIQKSQKRHRWIVWMYTSNGNNGNPDAPYKPGIVVTSRKIAKLMAERHANRRPGNKACWTRYSHNVRGRDAQSNYISFFDVTSTYHMGNRKVVRVLCDLSEIEFVNILNSPFTKKRYFNASRNPIVNGKRRDCVYRSHSLWPINGYLLEIFANYFWTESDAQDFCNKISHLTFDKQCLQFLDVTGNVLEILAKHGEWLNRLEDDVQVKKLKASAFDKTTTQLQDYEIVDFDVEDVIGNLSLNTFFPCHIGVSRLNECFGK